MAKNRELSKFGSFVGVTSSSIGVGIATTSTITPPFVGIGTTIATQLFQVGAATSVFVVTGIGSVGVGTTAPLQQFQIGVANTLGISTDNNVFVVTGVGSVGVGTTKDRKSTRLNSSHRT